MGLKIYSATLNLDNLHPSSIKKVLEGIEVDRVCGIVFYGVSPVVEYPCLLNNLRSIVCDIFGRRLPVTLVPQYLLPQGGLWMDIYTVEGNAKIDIKLSEGVCCSSICNGDESLLIVEGISASDFTDSVCLQSREVFCRLNNLLMAHGFAVDDIVRQWNYIGNIVSYRDGKQNYQEFNDARTSYYEKGQWRNGYPAATGIGVSCDGIIVGAIAFKGAKRGYRAIYPIDNPLQVAAHAYSKRVLIDDAVDAKKSTPKFERAKLIETNSGACCFVSGTAAIRGEESVDASSARVQTIMTIENIEHLVSKENLLRWGCKPYELKCVQLQVFIKNREDYQDVRAVVEQAYPQLPVVYTVADVCRSELLVEIEAILIS